MKLRNTEESLPTPHFLQCIHNEKRYVFVMHNALFLALDQEHQAPFPVNNYGYEVLYCRSGSCRIVRKSGTSTLTRENIILISPWDRVKLPVAVDEGTELLCLRFSMYDIDASEKEELELPFARFLKIWSGEELPDISFPVLLKQADTRRCEHIFNSIFAYLMPGGMLRWFDFNDAIYQLLSFLVRQVFLEDGYQDTDNSIHIARQIIEQNYAETVDLDYLSQQTRKSKAQLCRSFRKHFGTTPIDYQLQIRMEQAKRFLAETRLSIKEIAAMLGFSSPYYFSSQFSKRVGMSPSLWRKSLSEQKKSGKNE